MIFAFNLHEFQNLHNGVYNKSNKTIVFLDDFSKQESKGGFVRLVFLNK